MSAPVIQLQDLGKRYRLGEHHGEGTDLRESMARLAARLRGRPAPVRSELWSLRHVSLDVFEGEAVGIVGSNGAGKSTLLKIISSITAPTEGSSRTRGRIGSLLEVGTGFHRELTGRENTFLNGAILGMSRREVTRRMDEIIEFAGLQAFMDTPVKRYSSGMYLRLGFAIAAHLEANILLVDEVLAVGDADFQRRCLGKMSEIGQSGRTVVFISHNMEAVARLCGRAVWLDKGQVRSVGPTSDVIGEYTRSSAGNAAALVLERDHTRQAQVISLAVVDADGQPLSVLNTWTESYIQVIVAVGAPTPGLDVGVQVHTAGGLNLLDEYILEQKAVDLSGTGTYRLRMSLPAVLPPGEYTLGAWLGTSYEVLERHEHAVSFIVEGSDGGSPKRLIRLGLPWTAAKRELPPG
ncbi:MAG: ABC transporter ATP-binding protein [Ilumatobacteraceae bacterium]|nr:ABC transporter ATP-binding protein [Ilumatobacteraceae bacterium]MBP7890578.1 ABC transporter ATP-binding protein [Ilumatobacteraceae bacterium]MBP8211161.1 ABC transporter ATP-binding protein [Ilumatobacteraceae bacterium]